MYRLQKKLIIIGIAAVLICNALVGCSQDKARNAEPVLNPAFVTIAADLNEEAVEQDHIMNIIEELASKKYMGRLTGSEGNRLAAQYISEYFKRIGLENPRGLDNYNYEYFQPLVELRDKPLMQVIDKKGKMLMDFNYPRNFVLRRLSSETNHIDMNAPLCLIDDIDMLYRKDGTLQGKIILVPWKYYSLLGSQNNPDDYAKVTGALGVISEFDLEKNELGYKYLKVRPLCRSGSMPDSYKPFAFVDSETFSKLTEAEKTGNKLHFVCNSEIENLCKASNCIGRIEGSDPVLKEEYIIIGAHFDHVGDNIDGTWNPGAFDNASGTAAMMELARVIKESKTQPKKSILFMAFNGEESGINGSWSYCQGPVYSMNKAVMINLDMVGSVSKLPLTIAVASDKSNTSLRDTLAEYADKLSISYKKMVEDGSDHTAFDNHGVPSVCLMNFDLSLGYHSPQDTIEKVSGDRIEEIVKLVLYYIHKNAY